MTRLTVMYVNAIVKLRASMSINTSPVKVENVLNPPQNPTIKRNLSWGDRLDFMEKASNVPNIKQLIKFAQKVAYGNKLLYCERSSAMLKRQMLPSPPPINTSKNLVIFFLPLRGFWERKFHVIFVFALCNAV